MDIFKLYDIYLYLLASNLMLINVKLWRAAAAPSGMREIPLFYRY
jgi:hypothetical protein